MDIKEWKMVTSILLKIKNNLVRWYKYQTLSDYEKYLSKSSSLEDLEKRQRQYMYGFNKNNTMF